MFERRGRVVPMLALAAAGCLWGTGFYFGKIALTEMPVASMVLFRFAFVCAGLLPVIFFDRTHFVRNEWAGCLQRRCSECQCSTWCSTRDFPTPVSHASLMVGTLPMLLAIAAVVFAGERLHFA